VSCGLGMDLGPRPGGGCDEDVECEGCRVCRGGVFVEAEGLACNPPGRCATGEMRCVGGSASCEITGIAAAGTTCRPADGEWFA